VITENEAWFGPMYHRPYTATFKAKYPVPSTLVSAILGVGLLSSKISTAVFVAKYSYHLKKGEGGF